MLGSASAAQAWHFDPPATRAVRSAARDAAATPTVSRANAPLTAAGLPITWCGDPQAARALAPAAVPVFQLIYAHPADQPDHFWRFASLLQADASYIDRFLAAESGRAEYMRFAMGTRCGPQYVSIIDWQMPRPRAAYVDSGGQPGFSQFDNDSVAAFGRPLGVNALIYLDGLVNDPGWWTDTYGGVAEALNVGDETAGPSNSNNLGGQFAYLFGMVGGKPGPEDQALDPATLLHEASHAIGAVALDAPDSTGAMHCYLTQDIMCYADGGPLGAAADLRAVCGYRNDVMLEPYDCSGTNYFNPAPAPGSYLATHWNLYDSRFMASCSQDQVACGAAQVPLVAIASHRAARLTLRAVTLADRTVRVSASVTGLGGRTKVSLCLSSSSPASARSRCRTQARRQRSVSESATLPPADGQGWRGASAVAHVSSGWTLRTSLRLP